MAIQYADYTDIGGRCDERTFKRFVFRAYAIINNETHGRAAALESDPEAVKYCVRDLIEAMAANTSPKGLAISSESQSTGGVSESYSYAVKAEDELKDSLTDIVYDYLLNVEVDGVSLLYRGRHHVD